MAFARIAHQVASALHLHVRRLPCFLPPPCVVLVFALLDATQLLVQVPDLGQVWLEVGGIDVFDVGQCYWWNVAGSRRPMRT